jgi:hypothetical protein
VRACQKLVDCIPRQPLLTDSLSNVLGDWFAALLVLYWFMLLHVLSLSPSALSTQPPYTLPASDLLVSPAAVPVSLSAFCIFDSHGGKPAATSASKQLLPMA